MSILKQQVNSSSDFLSFLSAITYKSSVSCSSCIFFFGQRDPMKIPILTLSSVLFRICQIPHVIFQTTCQLFFKFSMTLHCHEIQLLCTFLAQTSVKSSPLKCIFLRLSSSRVKIHQIPYVNFEATSQFLFRFFIIPQCHYL